MDLRRYSGVLILFIGFGHGPGLYGHGHGYSHGNGNGLGHSHSRNGVASTRHFACRSKRNPAGNPAVERAACCHISLLCAYFIIPVTPASSQPTTLCRRRLS
jgi:hypothetical protein